MKRKKSLTALALCLALSLPLSVTSAVGSPAVIVDGNPVKTDSPPIIRNDRTLVPLRTISEYLGYEVNWNDQLKQVSIASPTEKKQLILTVGQITAQLDGHFLPMDCPPILENNRTYVPLRFIAECYNKKVFWEEKTHTVYIGDAPATLVKNQTTVFLDNLPVLTESTSLHDTLLLPVDKILDAKNKSLSKQKERPQKKEPQRLNILEQTGYFDSFQTRWEPKNEYIAEDHYLIGSHEAYLIYLPRSNRIAVSGIDQQNTSYGIPYEKYVTADPRPQIRDGKLYLPLKYLCPTIGCSYSVNQKGDIELYSKAMP